MVEARLGDTFWELTVRRLGVRTGPSKAHPAGERAAVCSCSCGRDGVVVPLARLGRNKTCGRGHPRPDTVRARVLGYVRQAGAVRPAQVAEAVGITLGSAGGHLQLLLDMGLLERPELGVYAARGRVPEVLPPRPEVPPVLQAAHAARRRLVGAR